MTYAKDTKVPVERLMDSRIDLGNEIQGQIRALSTGLDGLRQRLDSELRLMHRAITDMEQVITNLEARVNELERRLYIKPEAMYAIELALRT